MATHILIVDDNADNVGVLEEVLTLEGIQYTSVKDPIQVDKVLAKQSQFDAVFLDLEMPNIDGYQLLDKFKMDGRFKNVPMVAYTVHVSEINEARKRGFHSFLGKPLDLDEFPGQLRKILRGERVWVTP